MESSKVIMETRGIVSDILSDDSITMLELGMQMMIV
jgi:hypothetical protein